MEFMKKVKQLVSQFNIKENELIDAVLEISKRTSMSNIEILYVIEGSLNEDIITIPITSNEASKALSSTLKQMGSKGISLI